MNTVCTVIQRVTRLSSFSYSRSNTALSRSFTSRLLNPSSSSHPTLFTHTHVHTAHCRCYSSSRPKFSDKNASGPFSDLSSVSASDMELITSSDITPTGPPKPDTFLEGVPGAQYGGKKLAIIFTCTVCETRSAKKFTEQAYLNGCVMVRCPGCENLHLIADRLGFFSDKDDGGWDVEKFLTEQGEKVNHYSEENVLEITMADVLGNNTERGEDGKTVKKVSGDKVVEENEEEKKNV